VDRNAPKSFPFSARALASASVGAIMHPRTACHDVVFSLYADHLAVHAASCGHAWDCLLGVSSLYCVCDDLAQQSLL